jgi:hypothetical protein
MWMQGLGTDRPGGALIEPRASPTPELGGVVAVSMIERARAAVQVLGRDPDLVARHIEYEDWTGTGVDQRELEIAGLLSVLYREAGRLLALAVDPNETTAPCDYIASPGTIELSLEDHGVAARWEVSWAQSRLELISFDSARDKWVTGYAAAEQAVAAADAILKSVTPTGMPAGPQSGQWDKAAEALRLALRLVEEARTGRYRTLTPLHGVEDEPT